MRSFALTLAALLLSASLSQAARISVTQHRQPKSVQRKRSPSPIPSRPVLAARADSTDDGDGDIDISSFHDLLYIANVTIGGIEYPMQLDTGSSDLWVKADTSPVPNSNQTDLTLNITYGIGTTSGHISYAPVSFAGINVTKQAFIDATTANNPILSYGVDGIVGLGFTKLSSIDYALNKTGATDGRSLLYNLFLDNPKEPNFIAFSLQRTSEASGDVDGSFTIGEYEEEYASVQNSSKISTYPESDPTRWTILLDALLIANNNTVTTLTSSVSGAPSGKAVVMLDSGTSYTYAPEAVCDAIYGHISGAKYSSDLGMWIVPCESEVDIALQFGNDVYPIHPIDVTPLNVNDDTMCVGSFVPQSVSVGAGQFDWLIGDNVMRSLYTVYDFGDFDDSGKMGNPFMQLLSLVDPTTASKEFHSARGGTASTSITYTPVAVSGTNAASDGGSTTVTTTSDIADTLNKLTAYIPAMLAVLALNALVILVAVIAGAVYLVRRRRTRVRQRRTVVGRASPMPLQRTSSFGPVNPPGADSLGAYQPVSMALTEDTFVPPTPAFSKPGFEGSTMRAGDRPKSVA